MVVVPASLVFPQEKEKKTSDEVFVWHKELQQNEAYSKTKCCIRASFCGYVTTFPVLLQQLLQQNVQQNAAETLFVRKNVKRFGRKVKPDGNQLAEKKRGSRNRTPTLQTVIS